MLQDDAEDLFVRGKEALRAHFGGFLPHSPSVHSEIPARIHVGSWVVQEEHVTGLVVEEPVPEFNTISAYRVEDGKIVKCMGLH